MNLFGPDPVAEMSIDELSRAAGGSGIGVMPQDQSMRIRAAERLQREERPMSVTSDKAWKYILGGEAVRAGIEMGVSNPAIKAPLRKYGLLFDAASNAFGANSSTNAGNDPYGRVRYNNGVLEQVSPSGTDAGSQATNAIEGLISAAQWTKIGALPASLFAGELTESQIHQAERDKAPILADIAARKGSYADLENAVRDLSVMNTAQSEPGKVSDALWSGLREEKKAVVDRHLSSLRSAIASGDKAKIDTAAEMIPHLAEYMDRFNADMEAVQTGSQEFTWPFARVAETVADEAPNLTMTHYLNPDRFIETLSGNTPSFGFLDYWDPSGKNMQQYKRQRAWQGKDKRTRTQGPELIEELHRRALEETNGVDPRAARDAKQKAIADNFSVADPGFGLYQ